MNNLFEELRTLNASQEARAETQKIGGLCTFLAMLWYVARSTWLHFLSSGVRREGSSILSGVSELHRRREIPLQLVVTMIGYMGAIFLPVI
jgi:hypothetical protein